MARKGTGQTPRARSTSSSRFSRRGLLVGLFALAALVAVVAVAGVVLARNAQETSPAPAATEGSQAEAAPGFALQTLDGESFSLAAAQGKVVAVIWMAPG